MKTKQLLFGMLLLSASFLIWAGCGDNHPTEHRHDAENTEKHEHAGNKHQGGDDKHGLQLNDGKKWTADFETTKGVGKMLLTVGGFRQETTEPTIEQYRAVGRLLQMTLNGIFDKCTMTGPAHDELHKFLVPVLGYVKELKENEMAGCEVALENLEKHLKLYGDYFEQKTD